MLILNYWKKFKYLSANTIYNWLHPTPSHAINLTGWLRVRRGKVVPRNFGDELNIFLLSALTDRPIHVYNSDFHRPRTNYMVIGSLIDGFTTPESIIWGSGLLSDKHPLPHKPKKVCAVRGPITRQYLLRNGVDCPEVYGDPALLTPMIYKPEVEKIYKVGIIPHIHDLHDPFVSQTAMLLGTDCHIIDFGNYTDWHDVIDQICQCECILSSSLHGLILADAYHIPNLWIRVSDKLVGGNCKFLDYFSAVNRATKEAVSPTGPLTYTQIQALLADYQPIDFNPAPLLEACPFEIKNL